MGTTPNDLRLLLNDCEYFIADILQDEQLSESAEDAQKKLLNNFRLVRERFPLDFSIQFGPKDEEGSDDNRSSSLGRSAPSDTSENQDDWTHDYVEDIPLVAAHELNNVIKQGYLEKRRKDHGFFSSEWQKRWCVLNNSVFYYYSSEKDKQQKGCFDIRDYDVQLVTNLRKDSKRNSCFELSAPGQQVYQFTAASPQDARDWVTQIEFVRQDLSSSFIPVDDDESEEPEEDYDDIEEDIYESMPEDFPAIAQESSETAVQPDYASYYQCLWDCQADELDELAFSRGDLIRIVSKELNFHGWWVGELNGKVGIVPKDFLQPAFIL
ncbi:src kinase-associated phosphoprotein 1 [Neosynchiropus ocellatus]